jgi:hypothetical protein
MAQPETESAIVFLAVFGFHHARAVNRIVDDEYDLSFTNAAWEPARAEVGVVEEEAEAASETLVAAPSRFLWGPVAASRCWPVDEPVRAENKQAGQSSAWGLEPEAPPC